MPYEMSPYLVLRISLPLFKRDISENKITRYDKEFKGVFKIRARIFYFLGGGIKKLIK